jgi:hypothetical protein
MLMSGGPDATRTLRDRRPEAESFLGQVAAARSPATDARATAGMNISVLNAIHPEQ